MHKRHRHCFQASPLQSRALCNHHVSLMGPDTSDAWHRMPRKILHPVPRKSENRDFRISGNPDSGDLEDRKSENPDFRISRNPDFRKLDF